MAGVTTLPFCLQHYKFMGHSQVAASGGETGWASFRCAPAAAPQVGGHSQLGRVELSRLLPLRLDYSRMPTGNPVSTVSRMVPPGEAAERYPAIPSFPLEGGKSKVFREHFLSLLQNPGSKTDCPERGDWRVGGSGVQEESVRRTKERAEVTEQCTPPLHMATGS